MKTHSDLGASSAHRWMNCPGSVRLCEGLESAPSSFASAGTAAHLLCEWSLTERRDPFEYLGSELVADDRVYTVDEPMAEAVKVYYDLVVGDLARYGGVLKVEEKFSLDWLLPGMFGRNDSMIVPDRVFGALRVYDYKNGRKAVSAADNPQCMYYALGGLGRDNPYLVEEAVLNIVQPNAWGKDSVESWVICVEDLYEWGYDVLRPAAERTKDPDAPVIPGDWCTFCAALAVCPARLKMALDLFDSPAVPGGSLKSELPEVGVLTPEELGRASEFFTGDAFASWVKALEARELELLQRGVFIPGRKLVEKTVRGNRKWADEGEVVARLKAEWGEEIFNSEIKSPPQMEKLLQKGGLSPKEREMALSGLTVRDEYTKQVVVSESDSRPSITEQQNRALELF